MNVKALAVSTAAMSAAIVSSASAPAFAHHSFAMFDRDQTVKVEGTVKELELINPHAWLQVVVADASGGTSTWSFEMGGAGQLARQGWTQDTVKPGDKVTVSLHPLKDGSHGGQLVAVVLPDGKELENRAPFGGVVPQAN